MDSFSGGSGVERRWVHTGRWGVGGEKATAVPIRWDAAIAMRKSPIERSMVVRSKDDEKGE